MPFYLNPETGEPYELRRDEVVYRKSLLLALSLFACVNLPAGALLIVYAQKSDATLKQLIDQFRALPFDTQNTLFVNMLVAELIFLILSILAAMAIKHRDQSISAD